MLAPYSAAPTGARVAAVHTWGSSRESATVRDIAGVMIPFAGRDPIADIGKVKKQLEGAKKYEESWKKYAEELKKWQEAKDAGKKPVETDQKDDVVTETETVSDPITGTWDYTISGGPIPEPVNAEMKLRLTGNEIEGRLMDPSGTDEQELRGRLEGKEVTLEIQQETPFGNPTMRGTLDRDDHMQGEVAIGDILTLDFEATRDQQGGR